MSRAEQRAYMRAWRRRMVGVCECGEPVSVWKYGDKVCKGCAEKAERAEKAGYAESRAQTKKQTLEKHALNSGESTGPLCGATLIALEARLAAISI